MKKNYLLWALAVVSLAGCSQNEITEESPDAHPAVGFSVYTGTQARGAETDNNAIQGSGKGFGILAYYTGQNSMGTGYAPNFMWNQQVTFSSTGGDHWEYTPLKYWPNTTSDKVSFYAYAPYLKQENTPKTELSGNTATGYPTIKFTVADADKTVDLVTAKKENETKPATDTKVSFSLKHVLTKATFKAKLSAEYYSGSDDTKKTKIYLTGASLVGTSSASTGLYSYATYKFEDDKWDYTTTGSGGSAKAALMSTDYSLANILNTATINSGLGGYNKSAIEITYSSSSATDLFKSNESLYLIPANNDSGISSDKKVQVQLEYDIVTADTNLSGNSSVVPCKVIVDLTTGTLKQNAAYTYTFILGLTEVKVEASMDTDGWTTTDGNKDVDVPTKTAS